jgi:hypothetical protein
VATTARQTNTVTGDRLRGIAPWLVLGVSWLLILTLTHPLSTGDTFQFVESIGARFRGRNYNFWDFGHLFWRPLASVMAWVARAITGSHDLRIIALRPMVVLNELAVLGSACFLLATLRRLHASRIAATAAAIAFLGTYGMMVFAQTGTAYMSGMLLLTVALYLTVIAATSERRLLLAAGAGVAVALAAAFWFNYVVTIPAIAVAAFLLGGKRDWRAAAVVVLAAGVTGCVAFIGTALAIGLRTPAEFWAWFERSSHGISGVSGIPRAALGFARSLLFVDEDGGVLRRFLHMDPYAPVTLLQAATTRVWLLGLVWLVGIASLVHLVRARRHFALLAVFAAAAIPVMLFAVSWQGGDATRWFPLYPFLILVVHAVLADGQRAHVVRIAMVTGLLIMAVNNIALLSTAAAERRRDQAMVRLMNMHELVREGDVLFCTHHQDDLVQVPNMYPLQPVLGDRDVRLFVLVELAAPQVERWQRVFARRVRTAWDAGNHVWVSKRLLAQRPEPEWEWIEGTDPRISWRGLVEFVAAFDVADIVGAPDGFVILKRTPANEALVARYFPGAEPS